MRGTEKNVGAVECGAQLNQWRGEVEKAGGLATDDVRNSVRDTMMLINGSFRRLLNGDRPWDGNIYRYSF